MKTLTVCGSMRFMREMQEIAFQLETLFGCAVLQCVYPPQDKVPTDRERRQLKETHRQKIRLSDAIYVVDIQNYIGDSVKGEIAYAQSLGKEVIYHSRFSAENGL